MRAPFLLAFSAALAFSALVVGCASTTVVNTGDRATVARFEAFQSGNTSLASGILEAGEWGANRRNALALHNEGKWRELADLVQRTGIDRDLAWYYLGRAAAGLGHRNAAQAYFERSIEAANSTRPGRRCNDPFDLCDGFTFPAAARAQLDHLSLAAAAQPEAGGPQDRTPKAKPASVALAAPETTPAAANTRQAPTSSVGAPPSDAAGSATKFFDNPAKVCGALSSLGLGTANRGGWKPDRSVPGEWVCATDYFDIGEPVSELRLPTNISFYVFGDGPKHVTKISFILNVNNPSTQQPVLDKLKAAVTKLYSEFGEKPPAALMQNIAAGKPYKKTLGDQSISFEKNVYRIVEFKLTLTDKP